MLTQGELLLVLLRAKLLSQRGGGKERRKAMGLHLEAVRKPLQGEH